MTKSSFEVTSTRVEQYLSGRDRAASAKEVAEFLGVATSTAYGILQLMEVFGTVQKVKRGGRQYYLPKGVYSEEQISALLPPKKVKPEPRRRRSILRSPRRPKSPVRKSILEEHLSTMRALASTFEGLPALAMIGLTQIDAVEDDVVPAAEVIPRHLYVAVEEKRVETPKKIEPFSTVEHLPKDVRRLTLMQIKYINEHLKELPGYYRIESYETAFAEFSALKNGSYGNVLYLSISTNPWEQVYRVTMDDSIPLEVEEPVKRLRGRRRSKYDPMIDRFMELGQDLVEIDVKGKTPSYVKSQLQRRIEDWSSPPLHPGASSTWSARANHQKF